jgi:HAE1 family hydrophobic/amphiphilic exporter-1
MTAMTTTLAMTPLAIGIGEGGETQAPMARAIIGGLISSTLITLIVVPTVYAVFEGRKMKEASQTHAIDGAVIEGSDTTLGEAPV